MLLQLLLQINSLNQLQESDIVQAQRDINMQACLQQNETLIQSQVQIFDQIYSIKLLKNLKLFKTKEISINGHIINEIFQICQLKDDFSTSFSIIFRDQKSIKSQKIGLDLRINGYPVLRCFFKVQCELKNWQTTLRLHIPQNGFHSHFKAMKILGKGTQGTVYQTKSLIDGKQYAVKGIPKLKLNMMQNGKDGLINQINILRLAKQQNLIKFYGLWESQNTYYIQLQLQKGHTLLEIIQHLNRPMEKKVIQKILVDVLKGLQYLSSKRILHRDIKPQNIIVNSEKTTILDFGLATEADLDSYIFKKCGTPGFIAPQIANLQFHEKIDPKCDIFSLGSIFHILLTGKILFQSKNLNEMITKNRECDFDLNDISYNQFDSQGMDLLKKMLAIDPLDRINSSEALNHSYLKEVQI